LHNERGPLIVSISKSNLVVIRGEIKIGSILLSRKWVSADYPILNPAGLINSEIKIKSPKKDQEGGFLASLFLILVLYLDLGAPSEARRFLSGESPDVSK
jgi:hypothetical protein